MLTAPKLILLEHTVVGAAPFLHPTAYSRASIPTKHTFIGVGRLNHVFQG